MILLYLVVFPFFGSLGSSLELSMCHFVVFGSLVMHLIVFELVFLCCLIGLDVEYS